MDVDRVFYSNNIIVIYHPMDFLGKVSNYKFTWLNDPAIGMSGITSVEDRWHIIKGLFILLEGRISDNIEVRQIHKINNIIRIQSRLWFS